MKSSKRLPRSLQVTILAAGLFSSMLGSEIQAMAQELKHVQRPESRCTDYIAFASSFGERARLGEVEGVFCSFQTDRRGGFTDGEVEFLRRLMPNWL